MSTLEASRIAGLVLTVTLAGAIVPPPLYADSWRCAHRLVGDGQTIDEVHDRCGDPVDRAFWTEWVTVRVAADVAVTRPITIERWTYNPGPRQFLRYLTFREGVLVAIDEGSYGY